MNTQFVGSHFPNGLAPRERTEFEKAFQVEAEKTLLAAGTKADVAGFTDPLRIDAWRNI